MDYRGGDYLNGRLVLRTAVWMQAKVRVCGLGLQLRLNVSPRVWRTAPMRRHMRLAALYKGRTFLFLHHTLCVSLCGRHDSADSDCHWSRQRKQRVCDLLSEAVSDERWTAAVCHRPSHGPHYHNTDERSGPREPVGIHDPRTSQGPRISTDDVYVLHLLKPKWSDGRNCMMYGR